MFMRVREVVRKATDRIGEETYGKVMAVQRRTNLITVIWENGKISDHDRKDLILIESPYRSVDLSEQKRQ